MVKYTFIKISKDAKKILDERLKHINENELKKLGVYGKRISQIDFTKFLFKNRTFISDNELKEMAKRRNAWRLKRC